MPAAELTYDNNTAFDRIHPFRAWFVILLASGFFFYEFVQMSIFNVLSKDLISAFSISAAQFGNLSATYFYTDVFFLLPAGLILDRFSPKRVIIASMTLCVLSTFVFSQAHTLTLALITHGLTGIGSAFCLLSCLKIASRWFEAKKMALVTGFVVTMAMAGGAVAQSVFAGLATLYGWRHAVLIDGVMGIGILLLIATFVRDYPPSRCRPIIEPTTHTEPFWTTLRAALSNTQNWFAGLYTSLINLPIFLLGQTWGAMYLTQQRGLTGTDAGYVSMMIFVGMIIGSPAFGWYSDRIGLRKPSMVFGALASLVIILAIMYIPHINIEGLYTLYFLLGFAISSQIIGYPVIAESNPSSITATSLSVASVLIMLGGFTEPVFGWLLQTTGHSVKHGAGNVPIYDHHSFIVAFMMMPVAFILGLVCTYFLKETRCRRI